MSEHTLTLSSGLKLGYAEYGSPTGQPLFYFHGWPSSRLQGEIMDDLGKQKGIRVVAPDRPGIGLSDFQPGRRLLDWPPVLKELADHLGWDKFSVLGISGGGPYTLVTAHDMPERIVKAGICCGAVPLKILGTRELLWVYRLALWSRRWLPFMLGPGLGVTSLLVRQNPSRFPLRLFVSSLCPEDKRAMSDPRIYRILSASCLEALRGPVRGIRLDGDLYSSDWGFNLGDISLPISFWHGALDRNIPMSFAQRTAAMLPHAQWKAFPQDGHYSMALLRIGELVQELLGV